jgi:hypothetical protein
MSSRETSRGRAKGRQCQAFHALIENAFRRLTGWSQPVIYDRIAQAVVVLQALGYRARMRYVVAVVIVTVFLIWDATSNQGRYLDHGVRLLRHAVSYFGG